MRVALLLFGLVASALAAITPIAAPAMMDEVDIEKCIQRCYGYPTYGNACLAACNMNLGKKIEQTLAKMTLVTDPATPDDFRTLYTDGMMLQNQLFTLKKAVQQQQAAPPNFLGALFPNLGFYPPPNAGITPYAAPAQPQYPGFLVQISETITNLLNQVIKRQQEILQMIIGCKCTSDTATEATTVAAPTTTAAPARKEYVPDTPVKVEVVPPVDVFEVPVVPVKKPVVPIVDVLEVPEMKTVKVPDVVKEVPTKV